jgi:DNA-binding protein HU-beta
LFHAVNLFHMNKAELANLVSDKIGVTKKQAEDMLDFLTETIINTIKTGGDVTLTGFGTFSARVRKGRTGVNPQNPSESIEIPPTKVVKFKAGKTLKDELKASQRTEDATTDTPIEEVEEESAEEETPEENQPMM